MVSREIRKILGVASYLANKESMDLDALRVIRERADELQTESRELMEEYEALSEVVELGYLPEFAPFVLKFTAHTARTDQFMTEVYNA